MFCVFVSSKDVTSAMLVAIFVSDVTTSTAHLYEIDLIDNIDISK